MSIHRRFCVYFLGLTSGFFLGHPTVYADESITFSPENLAVIVNTDNPKSVEVGEYYIKAHQMPKENLIRVNFKTPEGDYFSPEEFEPLRQQILAATGPKIQGILLAWSRPYTVVCNSITSALTLGYDAKQCTDLCGVGRASGYFNSNSRQPFQDHKMKLSMLLPVDSVEKAKAVIDQGVLSTFRLNDASAYLLKTSDKARSVRHFPPRMKLEDKKLDIKVYMTDSIKNQHDVMFYFTGLSVVPDIATNTFLPGAVADHLTSYGGHLDSTDPGSSLKWLEAGATASYGSVSEPCNYWQKFPDPIVMMKHYLSGQTVLEAYWKSVKWPMQGIFIGDPLARPYCTGC